MPTWGPPPGPRLGSPEIFGYLVNWDLGANIDYGAITTIAYFGLGAGADGHLVRKNGNGSTTTEYSRWLGTTVTNSIAQAHANSDKFVLTVERMAWDDGGKAVTRALLSSTDARTSLIADIVSEIGARGVDGVSLDFEPILSDQRDNFAYFVNELRAALYVANPAYQLTFAATGSQPGQTYQMIGAVTASGAADAVIIMGYPLRAIDARYAGGLAPMYSPTSYDLKQITNAYLVSTAPDKIVMALPWYGREWPTVTSEVNSLVQTDRVFYDRPYNIGYTGALQAAAIYGRQVDPAEESAWTEFRWRFCAEAPDTWKQIYYDDVETLGYKFDWVVQTKGLAGIGIFALGYDNDQPELWKLLRVKYRGLVDTSPPTGGLGLAADEKQCQAPQVRIALNAADGSNGSGAVFMRLSNVPNVGTDGTLVSGRTYPTTSEIPWPMDDPTVGGSSALGSRTVYAQWRDVAGNWSGVTSTSFNLSLPGAASVTIAAGAQFVGEVTVPVTVTQAGGRPVSRVIVSNNATTQAGVLTSTVDVPLGQATNFSLIDPQTGGTDTDGPHTVYVQWQDSAGCWSQPLSTNLTLDRLAPSGSLSLVDAPTLSLTGNVQVLAPASDATSGVQSVELSNDGATWSAYPATSDPIPWSAGDTPDGTWTISVRWRDEADNVSDVLTAALLLDRHGPTGTLTILGGAAATSEDTVTIDAPASAAVGSVVQLLLANDPALVSGVLSTGQAFTPGAPINWALPGAGTTPGVAEGPHTVYAQWQDSAGQWSQVASDTITIDRTPPLVSALVAVLAQGKQLGTASVPVSVSWQASDPVTGVSGSVVETSRNGGPWTVISHSATPTSATVQIDRTSTWLVRVTATDGVGNASVPLVSAPLAASVTEDRAAAVKYTGTWKKSSNSSASSGSTRYATAKGATALLTFTGRSVSWVAPVGPKLGQAKVLIDGKVVATIDLKASAQQRRLVFSRSWASSGQHTIRIKVLGTSGRPRVDLDAFVVLT